MESTHNITDGKHNILIILYITPINKQCIPIIYPILKTQQNQPNQIELLNNLTIKLLYPYEPLINIYLYIVII